MLLRIVNALMILLLTLSAFVIGSAQSADNQNSIIPKPGELKDDDHPKSFKETLEKMRIEKEKKEYKEMLDRGEEAMKLTEELEKTFEQNGKLSDRELVMVNSIEKLVKKIRSELGGDDDEGDMDAQEQAQKNRLSSAEAVKALRSTTHALFDELKKTTRFSISAAAIQSSNAVLRVVRIFRFAN